MTLDLMDSEVTSSHRHSATSNTREYKCLNLKPFRDLSIGDVDAGTPEDSIAGTKLVRQKIFSRGAPE